MTQRIIDEMRLRMAYTNASKSLDPSTQNGVVIVGPTCCVGGNNRLPDGMVATPEQWRNRDWKYPRVVHAELDAITKAAFFGYSTYNCTIYGTWLACENCAKAIIGCGIKRVVGHKLDIHDTHPTWSKSIAIAKEMFAEANVAFEELECKIGMSIKFNYEIIHV